MDDRPRGRPVHSLGEVQRKVVSCRRCVRLRDHCRAVARTKKRQFRDWDYWGKPVPALGDASARLLIVGLAPAAHGANRTGRMFTGDSSGDWLYEALFRFGFATQAKSVSRTDGLHLKDCFITAAARCAPPQNRPTADELANCRPFLETELRLLTRVSVVVPLGRVGYASWLRAAGWWESLAPSERPTFAHGHESVLPDGTVLLCSYHPSRQNTNTGRLTRAMWHSVFRRARSLVDLGDQRPATPDLRGGTPR